MDVILPAIIFQHLGNNIAFRWTNSFFYKKHFLHFVLIIIFFNFLPVFVAVEQRYIQTDIPHGLVSNMYTTLGPLWF